MFYEFVVFEYNEEDLGVYLLITSPKDDVIQNEYTDEDDFCLFKISTHTNSHGPVSWLPSHIFEVKDPDIGKLDPADREAIGTVVKRFHDNDIDAVDLDSWAAEFVFAELARDWDMHRNSFYMYTAGGKLRFGPQWDFDGAFGASQAPHPSHVLNRPEGFSLRVETNYYFNKDGLITEPAAAERVIQRWKIFSESVSVADIVDLIDAQYEAMQAELESSYDRWGGYKIVFDIPLFEPKRPQVSNAGGHPLTKPFDTLDEQVDWLKTSVKKRYEWLDDHINELKNPGSATELTVKNWGVFFIVFVILAVTAGCNLVALTVVLAMQCRKGENPTPSSLSDSFL
jgi:hypothetical protein